MSYHTWLNKVLYIHWEFWELEKTYFYYRKNASSSGKSSSPPSEAVSKWVSAAHRASKKSGSGFLSKQAAVLGVGVKSGKGLVKLL